MAYYIHLEFRIFQVNFNSENDSFSIIFKKNYFLELKKKQYK